MKGIVLGLFALSLAAQEPRFDARSRLVLCPVNVMDAKGRPVEDLEAGEFQILDDGRPRKATVDHADTGVAPIALMAVVQTSGISAAVLESVRKIGVMVQPVVTGQRGCAGVIGFDQRVAPVQECTGNADLIAAAFRQLRPLNRPGEERNGRMLDAVQAAIDQLAKRQNVRRVLVLISESRDRGSETSLETALVAAQTAGVTVYGFTYSAMKAGFTSKLPPIQPRRGIKPRTPNDGMQTVDGLPSTRGNPKINPPEQQVDVIAAVGELARLGKEKSADALTQATGGAIFSFTRLKALEEAIQKLGAELHAQYIASFVPEPSPAGYHKLEVRITRPGEYTVRSRPGYWSTGEAH
jgi:VWFA-related protein